MQPTPVLIVGDEELFTELLGLFSPRQSRLEFAGDPSFALKHCRTLRPGLVILPLNRPGQWVGRLIEEATRIEAKVLGLGSNGVVGAIPPPGVHRLVPIGDHEAVFRAAIELLAERRVGQRPDLPPPPVAHGEVSVPPRVEDPGATRFDREADRFARLEQALVTTRQTMATVEQADAAQAEALEALRLGQRELQKLVKSQGDQVVALGSGLEQVVEIAASAGLTLEEAKREVLGKVAQVQQPMEIRLEFQQERLDAQQQRADEQQEAIADALRQLDELSGRTARLDDAQRGALAALRAELPPLLEGLRQDQAAQATQAQERLERSLTEATSRLDRSHESLRKRVGAVGKRLTELSANLTELSALSDLPGTLEQVQQTQRSFEQTLARRDDDLVLLADHVEELAGVAERVEALEPLAGRVEALEPLARRVDGLEPLAGRLAHHDERLAALEPLSGRIEALGDRLEALEALARRLGELDPLADRIAALEELPGRVDALDELAGRVGALEGLAGRVGALEGLAGRVGALEELPDRVGALERLPERVGELERFPERVEALEPLAGRVAQLEPLTGQVEQLAQAGVAAQRTFEEVRDEILDLLETVAGRVEEVAAASATRETLDAVMQQLAQVIKDNLGPLAGKVEEGQQQGAKLKEQLDEQGRVLVQVVRRLDRLTEGG